MRFDPSVILDNWHLFATGAWLTLRTSFFAILLGFVVAIPLALLKLARSPFLSMPATVYVETFRNVPFIVVLYLFFYGLPMAEIVIPAALTGTLALGLFAASYFTEIIRSAILSVPRGQLLAARAIGMSYLQGLQEVVVPQMLRFLIPPSTNASITFIKETSVLATIAVAEVTYQGLVVQGNTFAPFEVFFTTAMIYWLITGIVGYLSQRYERRLGEVQGGAAARHRIAARFLSLDHRSPR